MNVIDIFNQNHEKSVLRLTILEVLKAFSRQRLQYGIWRNAYPGKRRLLFEIEKRKAKY